MQLSKFTDFALRIMMHLAVADNQMLSTRQIAEIHNQKYNHFAKVTHWLVKEGYVQALRGRSGGLRLAQETGQINIGHLIRKLEGKSALVECMQPDGGTCLLTPVCGLTAALNAAQDAFYKSLENITLADLTQSKTTVSRLLRRLNSG